MDRNIGTWKVPERGAIAGYEALERKLVPTRGRHNFPLSGMKAQPCYRVSQAIAEQRSYEKSK